MHLFYRINRVAWKGIGPDESGRVREAIDRLCEEHPGPSHPRISTYVNVGGKADIAFFMLAEDLGRLASMHRALECAFPPGTLVQEYCYLSVTELSEYMTSENDHRKMLVDQESLEPGSQAFEQRLSELRDRMDQYARYRLYPEMPDWELMGFYPMSKRRTGSDNWYMLDFAERKRLMGGHARVGRKYSGRVSQLITGSTGLDDWEWGVTLMAHQADSLKDIVYEMRFDEVSARYADFGPFYINMRMDPAAIWDLLKL